MAQWRNIWKYHQICCLTSQILVDELCPKHWVKMSAGITHSKTNLDCIELKSLICLCFSNSFPLAQVVMRLAIYNEVKRAKQSGWQTSRPRRRRCSFCLVTAVSLLLSWWMATISRSFAPAGTAETKFPIISRFPFFLLIWGVVICKDRYMHIDIGWFPSNRGTPIAGL